MADKNREQRRAKRLAKQKKKRASASRPAMSRGGTVGAAPSFKAGLGWPVGDCFVTTGWDSPGASVQAVVARSHADGRTVAAFVEVERSGPGIVSARILTVPLAEMVLQECIRISESSGEAVGFQGAPPGIVVGLLRDAEAHGEADLPADWRRVVELMSGIEPELPDTPFGPDTTPPPKAGLLDRLFRFLG